MLYVLRISIFSFPHQSWNYVKHDISRVFITRHFCFSFGGVFQLIFYGCRLLSCEFYGTFIRLTEVLFKMLNIQYWVKVYEVLLPALTIFCFKNFGFNPPINRFSQNSIKVSFIKSILWNSGKTNFTSILSVLYTKYCLFNSILPLIHIFHVDFLCNVEPLRNFLFGKSFSSLICEKDSFLFWFYFLFKENWVLQGAEDFRVHFIGNFGMCVGKD